MKRIVLFTRSLGKGGTDKIVNLIGNELCSANEIYIVIAGEYDKRAYKFHESIKIVQLAGALSERKKYIKFLVVCKDYATEMRKIQPDIIISFLPQPCIISSVMKSFIRTPLVCAERSNPYLHYKGLLKIAINLLYGRADVFVVQSIGAREFFGRNVKEKTLVIGNPIKVDAEADKAIPEKIVAVGRHVYEKNYLLLIKAFHLVLRKFPNAKLTIYGRLDEVSDEEMLISKLNLSDRIHFEGQVDDVPVHIKDAAVFVLSSLSEGMPNALMEAMAMGLPCVATDCPPGGVRELIINEENGVLVRNDDAEDLARGIISLLDDREKARRLGSSARNIRKKYDYNTIINEWKALIEKTAGAVG